MLRHPFLLPDQCCLQLWQDEIGRNPAVLNVMRIIQAAIEAVRGEERGAHAIGVAVHSGVVAEDYGGNRGLSSRYCRGVV